MADTSEELTSFTPLNLEWDSPSIITNAIIDIANTKISVPHYLTFLQELEDLGCHHVEIRIWGNYNLLLFYKYLLDFIEDLNINSIELILPSNPCFSYKDYYDLQNEYSKINKLSVYNCSNSLMAEINEKINFKSSTKIFGTSQIINDQTHCGIVSPYYFVVNPSLFTESLRHNTCLNRKIGIDSEGRIKNCPSCLESFGQIEKVSIKSIINKPDFTRLWSVNKDEINICKVCEFRYMCTDCRAFVSNTFDKPVKCGYDPFTCKWNDGGYKQKITGRKSE